MKYRLVVSFVSVMFAGMPASAAFVVTQNNNPTALQTALLGSTTGLSGFSTTIVNGVPDQFGLFTGGLPAIGLDQGIVLSTGTATQIPGVNTGNDLSTNFGVTGAGVFRDPALLRVSFNSDGTANQVFFQFVFGSDEFLDFAGSQFNDRFELRLNGVNLARLTNGQDVTVNNLAASPTGPFNPDYINNPAGSGTLQRLDGYTVPLTFTGNLAVGSNTLEIFIADVNDGVFDSAVFVRGNTLGTVNPGVATPVPATALVMVVGFGGLFGLRRRSVK